MKTSDQYFKIVEWSEEDQCYIGRCPGIVPHGGVHGEKEAEVYKELCQVVEEWIKIYKQDKTPLPPATAGKEYSGKFMLRIGRDLHEKLSFKAMLEGDSLNSYCKKYLQKAT